MSDDFDMNPWPQVGDKVETLESEFFRITEVVQMKLQYRNPNPNEIVPKTFYIVRDSMGHCHWIWDLKVGLSWMEVSDSIIRECFKMESEESRKELRKILQPKKFTKAQKDFADKVVDYVGREFNPGPEHTFICIDNLGLEDRLSKGVSYILDRHEGQDMIWVHIPGEDRLECLKERFDIGV